MVLVIAAFYYSRIKIKTGHAFTSEIYRKAIDVVQWSRYEVGIVSTRCLPIRRPDFVKAKFYLKPRFKRYARLMHGEISFSFPPYCLIEYSLMSS